MDNENLILRALKYILLKWGSTDTKATEIILDINKVLNPKEKDPTIKEQTDKSMNRVIKAGQDCPRCGVIGVCAEKLQYHNSGRCLPRSKKVKVEK